MKTITNELQALLDFGAYRQADLHTVTPAAGPVLRFGSMPGLTLIWDGHAYPATGPMLERGTITSKLHRESLDVDNVDITLTWREGDTLGGVPVPLFIRNGGLTGARLLLQKAFCAVDGAGNVNPDVTGVIYLFEGRLSAPKPGRMACAFTLVADTERLAVDVPRNTVNLNCMNTHYDTMCGLSRAAFTHRGQVDGGNRSTLATALPQPDGYFAQGFVVFVTGLNAGARRAVRRFANGTLTLMAPLDFAPATGDLFDAVAGCDLSAATCDGRFGNLPRRRCFPFVPAYEDNL